MEETDGFTNTEALKLHTAIQCAKASILLSSLKYSIKDPQHEESDRMLMQEVENLRTELKKERIEKRRARIFGMTEYFIQICIFWHALALSFIFVLNFI